MAKGPQPGLYNFGAATMAVEEAISNLVIGENIANPYMLPSPPQSTEVDTGFDPSTCGPNCRLTFSLLVETGTSPNEVVYALFETVTASIIAANPDIRISRASEFAGVPGDVDMSFWLDSGTNTIHFEYDVDGGGKTVTLAAITTLGLELQEAP